MLFYQYTGFSAIPQAPEWLPRGKGTITVNCRNCGASFEERS